MLSSCEDTGKQWTERIGLLSVSEIGMGCMGLSLGYGDIPRKEDVKALDDVLPSLPVKGHRGQVEWDEHE